MCTKCGDSGYLPAMQYGYGCGTGSQDIYWQPYAVREPCDCQRWNWPSAPQPIIIPVQRIQDGRG